MLSNGDFYSTAQDSTKQSSDERMRFDDSAQGIVKATLKLTTDGNCEPFLCKLRGSMLSANEIAVVLYVTVLN